MLVPMTRFDRITADPAMQGGKPHIRDLRIAVSMIAEMVAGGKTIDTILDEYPYLDRDDIHQALSYTAALADKEYYLDTQRPA